MSCLLAHTYDPNKHNVDDWFLSEKLDGVRALFDGEFLFSRTGKKISPPAQSKDFQCFAWFPRLFHGYSSYSECPEIHVTLQK